MFRESGSKKKKKVGVRDHQILESVLKTLATLVDTGALH